MQDSKDGKPPDEEHSTIRSSGTPYDGQATFSLREKLERRLGKEKVQEVFGEGPIEFGLKWKVHRSERPRPLYRRLQNVRGMLQLTQGWIESGRESDRIADELESAARWTVDALLLAMGKEVHGGWNAQSKTFVEIAPEALKQMGIRSLSEPVVLDLTYNFLMEQGLDSVEFQKRWGPKCRETAKTVEAFVNAAEKVILEVEPSEPT